MQSLFKLNKIAFFAHCLCFVGVLVAYLAWPNTHPHAIAQTYRYALPNKDQLGPSGCNSDPSVTVGAGDCVTNYAFGVPSKIFTFNIIFGVLLFFAISALAHAYYATDGWHSGKYSLAIEKGWNPYRWLEYAFSASIMTILIGYAMGLHDGFQLLSLALITAGMQGCGFVVEAAIKKGQKLNVDVITGATWAGWCLFVAMWLPIVAAFVFILRDVDAKYNIPPDPVKVPWWVWFILIFQFVSYAAFGQVQLKHIKSAKGINPVSFFKIETLYLKLSFTAKIALAAGLGYGLLFRTRDCPIN